ncbi:MAG TPA: response regulator [Pirellulaceae bacterium]|nr:response regulator [Pirellulaceae bacterium]HMO93550.1 response regulator [Pirellulaceae bacterium]HMP70338.1 response regulator [Pirellulaceae bacterium]
MPTVLVVDDTAVDRRLAGGLLEKSPNLHVIYAENGRQALAIVEEKSPNLVVTDLQMPEIDGLELVNALAKSHPEIPVVLMTAHGSEVVAAQALANGAASYVPKNDLAENLVPTVTHILSMSVSDQKFSRLIQCTEKTSFEFKLDSDVELIEPLVDMLQQIVSSMELCDATGRIRVGVALENALENAIVRGNLEIPRGDASQVQKLIENRSRTEPYQSRKVYVTATIDREHCAVRIRDEGPGFNIDNIPKPGDPSVFRNGGGRGLVLMRNFMDECKFNPQGNEVELVKRRED